MNGAVMRYTLSFLLLAGVFLTGCGHKDPLYLPSAEDEAATESAP